MGSGWSSYEDASAAPLSMLPAKDNGSNTSSSKDEDEKKSDKVPIVYSELYNISFMGIEKLHPFDSCKYAKVANGLANLVSADRFYVPHRLVTDEELLQVHTQKYLDSLRYSFNVAKITEVPPVAVLPNAVVRSRVLNPMRLATAGTIMGAELALRERFSINLSGGYHHACGTAGGGFCVYSDISLAILTAAKHGGIKRAMIVDLDAHQGNGHARDKLAGVFVERNVEVYTLDMYNYSIYPRDMEARRGIDSDVKLRHHTKDREYLQLLRKHLSEAVDSFKPQFILYNAGTDCLEGDPLGCLSVSEQGIVERDEFVFRVALDHAIPILMVLSGGYQPSNGRIIASSIANLHAKFNLFAIPENAGDDSRSKKKKKKKKKVKKKTK